MKLESYRQVEVTREKIRMLEEQYEATRAKEDIADHARELTLRSLRKFINQMKEDIVRFESHAALCRDGAEAAARVDAARERTGGRSTMRPEDVLALLQRKPFQPIRIALADGRNFDVRQRELVMLGRTSMIVGIPAPGETEPIADRQEIFPLSEVSRMEPLEGVP